MTLTITLFSDQFSTNDKTSVVKPVNITEVVKWSVIKSYNKISNWSDLEDLNTKWNSKEIKLLSQNGA